MDAYEDSLGETASGLAAENIQARIRGNLMMALSNHDGWLVLTTGNKSEMSVGYATLYGDMAGGFAVIKDVPKELVYALTRRRNERAGTELVPASVLERPPSAELRPDQRDDDSLPPYELLDRILEAYVERDLCARGDDRRGDAGGDRGRGDPDGRPLRVQAAPGGARDADHAEGLRPRPPAADHQPLRRLSGGWRARDVLRAPDGPPSSSSPGHRGGRRRRGPRHCQTQVVRPRWRATARTSAWPELIGRRKLTSIDWPIAILPSS